MDDEEPLTWICDFLGMAHEGTAARLRSVIIERYGCSSSQKASVVYALDRIPARRHRPATLIYEGRPQRAHWVSSINCRVASIEPLYFQVGEALPTVLQRKNVPGDGKDFLDAWPVHPIYVAKGEYVCVRLRVSSCDDASPPFIAVNGLATVLPGAECEIGSGLRDHILRCVARGMDAEADELRKHLARLAAAEAERDLGAEPSN